MPDKPDLRNLLLAVSYCSMSASDLQRGKIPKIRCRYGKIIYKSNRYFEYTVAKERRYRRDGAYYVVSPVDVVESPQFFAWLCGFGADAQLLAPASAAEQMKAYIEEIAALYRGVQRNFCFSPYTVVYCS